MIPSINDTFWKLHDSQPCSLTATAVYLAVHVCVTRKQICYNKLHDNHCSDVVKVLNLKQWLKQFEYKKNYMYMYEMILQ